ncbi:hypothetical protein CRG98_044548 [Punica granatum]|uniref:Uncharacterized protein n=1 Tax=Punica granatum TaxID=22663 RepID=A0A2I0HTM0_PUNGR|nr:hypothetical protein CRG98_044548 [Punica granatum]
MYVDLHGHSSWTFPKQRSLAPTPDHASAVGRGPGQGPSVVVLITKLLILLGDLPAEAIPEIGKLDLDGARGRCSITVVCHAVITRSISLRRSMDVWSSRQKIGGGPRMAHEWYSVKIRTFKGHGSEWHPRGVPFKALWCNFAKNFDLLGDLAFLHTQQRDLLNLRSVFLVMRSRDRMVSANKATSYSRPPTTWRTMLAKAASM